MDDVLGFLRVLIAKIDIAQYPIPASCACSIRKINIILEDNSHVQGKD